MALPSAGSPINGLSSLFRFFHQHNIRMISRYFFFSSNKIKIPRTEAPQCAFFIPVEVTVVASECEKVGVINLILVAAREVVLKSGIEQMRDAVNEIEVWLDKFDAFLCTNAGMKVRTLITTCHYIIIFSQDFLMMSYLAELTKTQLLLHEKLLSF
ncbi:unnamed protein product [Soboliphyme baturini]|uniref:DHC_N1 domain-containing protein n=1 Tax=Soboliphyme baturini TaxID=241478 RepID=A0A183J8W2_9BILA|nr:unnamed protein product [Soboliphyme baturini]